MALVASSLPANTRTVGAGSFGGDESGDSGGDGITRAGGSGGAAAFRVSLSSAGVDVTLAMLEVSVATEGF